MQRRQQRVPIRRLGEGAREVARKQRMNPNTEREYRLLLPHAGLLEDNAHALPEHSVLRARVIAATKRSLCCGDKYWRLHAASLR